MLSAEEAAPAAGEATSHQEQYRFVVWEDAHDRNRPLPSTRCYRKYTVADDGIRRAVPWRRQALAVGAHKYGRARLWLERSAKQKSINPPRSGDMYFITDSVGGHQIIFYYSLLGGGARWPVGIFNQRLACRSSRNRPMMMFAATSSLTRLDNSP